MRKVLTILSSAALLFSLTAGSVIAAPPSDGMPKVKSDNLSSPLADAQSALRQSALEAKLQGKSKSKGSALQAANGQYVDFPVDRTDRVFVVLAEFGNQIHPNYGQAPGPLHNQIAEPDRAFDNTTIWQADYNKAHYEDMYFSKMKDYYKAQSSGRYTFNGDVTEWVTVPYNEARYGQNTSCGSNVCSTVWYLIRDAINIWTADRLADGWSLAQIKTYLDTFDVNDRYDVDGDQIFDEPDGYIDHFQIVHAGEGEETGGGAQGAYAIWSHRWYTSYQGIGVWGPAAGPLGGMEFGGEGTFGNEGGENAVGVWVGDYTMQPENGGLGVFAHEYAHDLGLPDQYDTAGGENGTGFWTVMSSGSYLGPGTVDIGSRPNDFNFWEKFQLGWAKYDVAFAGAKSDHRVGPSEMTTKAAQGLFVVLPDKEVATDLGEPYEGSNFFYSGAGDNLDNTMSKSFTLPAGAVSLSAQVRYEIELDWDYAYLTVNGTPVATNLSTATNPNGQNAGNGITGASSDWDTLTADLSAFAGQTVDIGFRYWTDTAVVESGFQVDAIDITGQGLEGAESTAGWTFDGFSATDGSETAFYFNAYVVENRTYLKYDSGLKTGPYNFGFLNVLGDWVEHFPYQDGILISYWDTSQSDNNTSQHPGEGLILPIDAHPGVYYRPDNNTVLRARILMYDATFGPWKTDALTLHFNSQALNLPSLAAVRTFDDAKQYWNALSPLSGVKNPHTGTVIRVSSISSTGFAQISVNP